MAVVSQTKTIRRQFYKELMTSLGVVWPVFSMLLGGMVGLGLLVAHVESWRLADGIYFAFITGLTVGYGDLVPHRGISRIVAVGIGFTGVLLTALFAAVSVRAMQLAVVENRQSKPEVEQGQ